MRQAPSPHGSGRSTAREILWANPVGAGLFGAANGAVLARKNFGPADAHRRQVAQLAGRLIPGGAIRLERLRGFGAPFGRLVTCGCARLDFADGSHGILIAAAEPVGRAMPLVERLQRLVEGIDTPIAAFARDGMFVGASDAARSLPGFRNLSEAGLDDARSEALKQGRAETPAGVGHMVLQRVGSGADVGLVALITPDATLAAQSQPVVPALPETAAIEPAPPPVAPAADLPMPDYEQAASSGEAPAEFALIDEFARTRPRRRSKRQRPNRRNPMSRRRRSGRCPTTNRPRFRAKRRPSLRWSSSLRKRPPRQRLNPPRWTSRPSLT